MTHLFFSWDPFLRVKVWSGGLWELQLIIMSGQQVLLQTYRGLPYLLSVYDSVQVEVDQYHVFHRVHCTLGFWLVRSWDGVQYTVGGDFK